MEYFLGSLMVTYCVLSLVLTFLAAKDVMKKKEPKSLITLFLLAPVIGPLIYFQTKIKRRSSFNPQFKRQ